MSGRIGFNLGIILPDNGQLQWGGYLNTEVFQPIIDAIQARVTSDGIDIQSALDFQGQLAVNLLALEFVGDTDTGVAYSLFYRDGELFVRDGSNRRVQITSGGSVNITGTGGFTGDYVAAGAVASFNSGGNSYTFTSSAGNYSTMEVGDVRIHVGSSANYTDVKTSPVLGSTYGLTLPSAPPVTVQPIVMDTTGTLYPSSDLDNLHRVIATTLTASVGRLTGIGAGNGGLGLVAADATGTLRSVLSASFVEWIDLSCAITKDTAVYGSSGWTLGTAGTTLDIGIPMTEGDRLDRIDLYTAPGVACTLTASLNVRAQGGTGLGPVAYKTFHGLDTPQGVCSLFTASPTMTGSMPITWGSQTGSLVLRAVENGAANQLNALKVTRTKRLI